MAEACCRSLSAYVLRTCQVRLCEGLAVPVGLGWCPPSSIMTASACRLTAADGQEIMSELAGDLWWLRPSARRPDAWQGCRASTPSYAIVSWSWSALALGVFLALLVAARSLAAADQADFAAERARMVTTIEAHAKQASIALGRDTIAPEILKVVGDVPRHEFVPDERAGPGLCRPAAADRIRADDLATVHCGADDRPARVKPGHKVLEIGTGSGYQAAVLSPLAAAGLFDRDRAGAWQRARRACCSRLGYGNVETRIADGYYGWPEAAPFDAIVVTAAASHIPPALIQQLKPGGRMVIPIGGPFPLSI